MQAYLPSPRDRVREQVARYEATDGIEASELRGYPCVIVTHTGRRTGAIRKTPLIRVVHEGRYVLVGSYGGRPEDPLWVHNLRAQPDITVRDLGEVHQVRARLLGDTAERDAAWASAVAAFPAYATYQEKTDRVIPVFVCDPR